MAISLVENLILIVHHKSWEDETTLRPRLFICATGHFAQLPLHAAGLYGKMGDDSVSHHLVPSYTPTLGVLIKLQKDFKTVRRANAKMHLAGVTHPFKGSQLHFAMAEVESIGHVVGPEIVLPTQDIVATSGI